MNFKGFKKVGEDEHKAHFENKSGHVITIAKKGLSKKHLEQLSGLPLHAASGGVVGMFDGGSAYNKELPKEGDFSDYAEKPTFKESMDIKNWVGRDAAGQSDLKKENVPAPISKEPEPALAQKSEPTLAPEEVPQDQVQQPAPQMAAQPRQPAQQPAQQPVQQQLDYKQSPEYQKSAAEYRAKKAAQWAVEDINWQRDLQNGHITPQTYGSLFAKQDTLGKIGTLFGLMVSGVGSGLAKQPNLVMQMMDNEIKNDLDAQIKSKDNAMNYYKAQQAAYLQKAQAGEAESQTALNWQTAAINKMRIAAWQKMQSQVNRLPNGQQKMQAQGIVDTLGAAVQEKNMQDNAALADQEFHNTQGDLRMLEGMGDQGAGRMAEDRENKYVDGFVSSKTPNSVLASNKVPGEVRRELIAKTEFDKAAKEYLDFAREHKNNWANLNPKQRLEIAKRGAVLGAELQGKYRMKTGGGVYKEGEQDFIQKVIPDTAVNWAASFNQIPKLEQLISNNEMEIKNVAGGYGLKPASHGGGQSGAPKQGSGGYKEGDTGTRKSDGAPIIFTGGKWRLK